MAQDTNLSMRFGVGVSDRKIRIYEFPDPCTLYTVTLGRHCNVIWFMPLLRYFLIKIEQIRNKIAGVDNIFQKQPTLVELILSHPN